MRREVERVCEQHANRFDCPDCVMHFRPTLRDYGLLIHDGGTSVLIIRYCPWCGTKLPDNQPTDG
jgi:hypothetical protein